MRSLIIIPLFAACGSNNAKAIDARLPDAPPDALLDAPMPPAGTQRYVIDREHLPTNNNEARAYGLDLDADGAVDNELGMVFGTFAGMGIDNATATEHAIDTGSTIMLVELDDLMPDASTFALYAGTNAMPAACAGGGDIVCRHHLAGTATFDVAATSARDTPLAGVVAAGGFTGGPGHLTIQLDVLSARATLPLIGARVKLTGVTDAALGDSILAGGISQADIDAHLIPAMQQGATAIIAHDCTALTSPPSCGCASGSDGATMIGLFDSNHDCAVTNDEIKNNNLIMSLLAPDIMLEGHAALSVGVGVTAVHAAFTP